MRRRSSDRGDAAPAALPFPGEVTENGMRLHTGREVRCANGLYGELADIVIDPIAKRVTHLVVKPRAAGVAGLVPVALVDNDADGALVLRCTVEEAARMPHVREVSYLRLDQAPVDDPDWDVGIETVLAMPYYEGAGLEGMMPINDAVEFVYDRLPKGEVEIRRASSVLDADGQRVGFVDGFLVGADGQITHMLLERGHVFGKREITVPIGAVARVENDEVTLQLARQELERLPSVRVHRWRH
jgi:sporulation protein YlmC with PRC-barrel domain